MGSQFGELLGHPIAHRFPLGGLVAPAGSGRRRFPQGKQGQAEGPGPFVGGGQVRALRKSRQQRQLTHFLQDRQGFSKGLICHRIRPIAHAGQGRR